MLRETLKKYRNQITDVLHTVPFIIMTHERIKFFFHLNFYFNKSITSTYTIINFKQTRNQ